MSASLIRSSTARSALRAGAPATFSRTAGLAGTSFVRNKVTLPDLPCTLKPWIVLITVFYELPMEFLDELPHSVYFHDSYILARHHNFRDNFR